MALIVSLLIATFYAWRGWRFSQVWSLCFTAYVSHLLLDFFGPDNRPPYGIPLFWPLSEKTFLSPVPLLLGVHHAAQTTDSIFEWIRGILDLYNVVAIALEIVIFVPFLALAQKVRGRLSTDSDTHQSLSVEISCSNERRIT
jgi:inner membrane protein